MRVMIFAVLAFAPLRPMPAPLRLRTMRCARTSFRLSPPALDQDVAVNNGDRWSGSRATSQELRDICDEAMSTREPGPVIPQWLPRASWLWKQWRGTIVRHVLPREVTAATVYALLVAAFFCAPWLPHEAWRRGLMRQLPAVERVWTLASGLVSFTLSFFLTQAYTFWREVYLVVRQVQGRLNDIGLLIANGVAREARTGEFTPAADELLGQSARYVRLWNMLLYASVTTRFAPLATPSGLAELMRSGAITEDERRALLEASTGHNAVLVWLSALFCAALADGRLAAGGAAGASGLTFALLTKLTELRATGASIADKLSGRMPLAYTQLVQILVDLFILATPFALMHSVGPLGAVMGTALLTLFYTSILNLAKLLLDPFGNVEWSCNPVTSGISISTATLIQETNVGSERWRRSGGWVPTAARADRSVAPADGAGADKSAQPCVAEAPVEALPALEQDARVAQAAGRASTVGART